MECFCWKKFSFRDFSQFSFFQIGRKTFFKKLVKYPPPSLPCPVATHSVPDSTFSPGSGRQTAPTFSVY